MNVFLFILLIATPQESMSVKQKIKCSTWIFSGKVIKVRDAAVKGRKLALVEIGEKIHAAKDSHGYPRYKKLYVSFSTEREAASLEKDKRYILYLKRDSDFGEFRLMHDRHGAEAQSKKTSPPSRRSSEM